MGLRAFHLVLFLLFCVAQVSSDLHSTVNEEEPAHISQAFHVFARGAERRLVQGIALRLSKYLNIGQHLPPAPAPAPAPHYAHLDCGGLCSHRCSLHSRPNVCLRACGTCCVRCKCVPPGTFGNRELCGKCYTDMTTHGNKTKCP
ncbi:gibberellin-regulated protein 14-like [Coffea eugenioides]|uniref:Uncharacterized protein n=1 Tax=Coffea arabica TaxID=13443 RepID=A0A6P6XFC7_COFAR|nr:gibberellin-regulated protein 14-like [Coffea arabica]XP_027168750.1 gibberellin-regulated protein 14-like [Coffea eugenioides]